MTIVMTKTSNSLLKLYTFFFLFFGTAMFALYGWLSIPMFSYIFSGLCCMLLACGFSVLVIINNGWKVKWSSKSLFLLALLVLTAIEFINTQKIVPSQPLLHTFFMAFPFISVCFEAFVLNRLIKTQKDLGWFMRAVQKVSILMCCISILQYTLYPNLVLFPLESEIYRNGAIRVILGGEMIYSLGAMFSIGNIFSPNREKSLSWINLVLVLVTLMVVRQVRTNTAYVLAVFALAFISSRRIPKLVRWMLYACVAALVAVGFVLADGGAVIGNLAETDFSVLARIRSIRFFWEKMREYPLLGMGFLYTSNPESAAYRLHCDADGYLVHTSDVGIMGLQNMMGLLGVIWFLLLLNKLRRNGNRQFAHGRGIHGRVMFWYVGITMINLIVTDLQRALIISVVLVITEKLCEFAAMPDETVRPDVK